MMTILLPIKCCWVAPVRERGLKFAVHAIIIDVIAVAPVRERGLKSAVAINITDKDGRSREGAWIEI